MAYDNTNRFSLFNNDRKSKDGDADYSGTLNVGGVEYWINAWKPKEGSKLVLSGSVKPKAAKAEGRPKPAPQDDDPYGAPPF